MDAVFSHFLNTSLGAIPLVAAVLLARRLLGRAPRWTICLLWALVAVRLLCPALPQSPVGLAPSGPLIRVEEAPGGAPVTAGTFAAQPGAAAGLHTLPGAGPLDIRQLGLLLWAIGAAGMLLFLAWSYLRLRRQVAEAAILEGRVWECDGISSPFLLGALRPRIYLPSGMDPGERQLVLAHERAHLARGDHWWKLLGWLLLSVTWFNPVMWLAYWLFCRDIELACDEKVAAGLDAAGRRAYSRALVSCGGCRRLTYVCPLAFGEVAVKERVRRVLGYRRPGFWLVLIALAAVLTGAVCFLTERRLEEPAARESLAPSTQAVREDIQMRPSQQGTLPERVEERKHTGSFSHSFAPGDKVYTGGQLRLDYQISAVGGIGDQETGLLLLLEGQPQPYRLSPEGELRYMHTFTGSCQPELWIVPVTGRAGDTLELSAFQVREPDYRNTGYPVPFAQTGASIPVQDTLILQADPARQEETQARRLREQNLTTREVTRKDSSTRLDLSVYPVVNGGQLKVRAAVGGLPGVDWTLAIYVNHVPVSEESLTFQIPEGSLVDIETVLDMQNFTGEGVLYAVLSCPGWRDANFAAEGTTISKTFYLTAE